MRERLKQDLLANGFVFAFIIGWSRGTAGVRLVGSRFPIMFGEEHCHCRAEP